jgi:DNA polymerase (family 10)
MDSALDNQSDPVRIRTAGRRLRACAKYDVVVEINAHPWRLDLDWRWYQAALDFGCMLSINPDSHSIPELDHMHWASRWPARGAPPPTVS